jgi:hypothetical protein
MKKRWLLMLLVCSLSVAFLAGCADSSNTPAVNDNTAIEATSSVQESADNDSDVAEATSSDQESADNDGTETVAASSDQAYIEATLNLANNAEQEWTYMEDADAWVLSVVSAVAYPELPDQQGVSVSVPGAYITGIDTDGDGEPDVTADTYEEAVKGSLVIDYEAEVISTNGQVYTAATAPVIINTGAAGYGSQNNSTASTGYAGEGYVNVAMGNRGKQDTAVDENGDTYYTGDAPSCLVDQKNAVRFVKYNILFGNLPGSVDYFVSTGGSGGGAHATMFAATSNNPAFYDYEMEAGAVGVYRNEDGSYSTTVTIDGENYEISDGAWGTIAYSPITSLYEADMAMAFEYYLDTTYDFNTTFQAQLAQYLSAAYMEYINAQNLSVEESAVGFDLNGDGDTDDSAALTIEFDLEAYPETNGYYGTYLDLYLAEFTANLQWYLDNLDYGEGWTWFDADGNALSDTQVAAMTSADKAEAFVEGRYVKGSSGQGMGGPGGEMGGPPDGGGMQVGTPGEGSTQSATSNVNSSNYETYEDMVAAYQADIEGIYAGDKYGNNIVSLYNPLNFIAAQGTESPTWARLVSGAAEGDISMFNSLNIQIAWLNAGVDAEIEWQWDGGHVPSEVLGDSFSLYVDQMYGEYVEGAVTIAKDEATPQTENGTATEPTGTDLSSWVNYDDIANVSFSLADAAAYRTAGASKAIPDLPLVLWTGR